MAYVVFDDDFKNVCHFTTFIFAGSRWIVEDTQRGFGSCRGQQQTSELRRPRPQKHHLLHFGWLRQKGTGGALSSPRHPLPGPGGFPSGLVTNSIFLICFL